MNELTLAFFSIFIYLSTVGFFWGVYRENRSAVYDSLAGKTIPVDSVERFLTPIRPAFPGFLNIYWRPLALFGILFLGIFGFFMEHVCDYP